jgi:hypothetical protein
MINFLIDRSELQGRNYIIEGIAFPHTNQVRTLEILIDANPFWL